MATNREDASMDVDNVGSQNGTGDNIETADTAQSSSADTENAANDASEDGQAKNNEGSEEEKKDKPQPYIGLLRNKKSLVTAVANKNMDLLESLLEKLKLAKQKGKSEEGKEQNDSQSKSESTASNTEANIVSEDKPNVDGEISKTDDAKSADKDDNMTIEPKADDAKTVSENETTTSESKTDDAKTVNENTTSESKTDDAKTVNENTTSESKTDDAKTVNENTTSESKTDNAKTVNENTTSESKTDDAKTVNENTTSEPKSKSKPEETQDDDDDDIPDYIEFPKLSPKTEISHALMMAITTKQAPMIDRLLIEGEQFGVDMHIVDSWCPLICTAAELGDIECFKVMIKHCKNLAISGHYGNILHSAVRSGNYELVMLTLGEKDIDPAHKSEVQGGSALLDAVRSVRILQTPAEEKSPNQSGDQTTTVKMDTSEPKQEGAENKPKTPDEKGDANSSNATDKKPCCAGKPKRFDLRIIKALISHGCDVNHCDNGKKTALHFASLLGYKEVVEYLLEIGADKHAIDSNDRSAFMYSLFFNHSHLYDILINKDKINDKIVEDEGTYLHFASKQCGPKAIEYLLKQGANPGIKNSNGETPLITAVVSRNIQAVEVLSKVPDEKLFNECDSNGKCAFHHAMDGFRECARTGEIADILIQNGADIDITDGNSKTALLQYIDDKEKVAWLLERGANPDYISASGLYPLLAACETSEYVAIDVVDLLLKYHVDITTSQLTCPTDTVLSDSQHVDMTPLQITIFDQRYDLTMLLLSADVCLNKVHDWLNVELNRGNLAENDHKWNAIYAYLRQKSHQPMGLKGISRLKILKLLGHKDVLQKVETLSLPVIMQSYLKWESYIADRKCFIEQFIQDYKSDSQS